MPMLNSVVQPVLGAAVSCKSAINEVQVCGVALARASFEILLDEDDPFTEYKHWIEDYYDFESLSNSVRELNERSVRGHRSSGTRSYSPFSPEPRIHRFLPFASGVPVIDPDCTTESVTDSMSGFSGANDNRWLLPMSMARGFSDIFGPKMAVTWAHKSSEQLRTNRLLQTGASQNPRLPVLLDAGTQILDISNRS
ncbi:hypothetical protein JVU11DRAFT_7059 [Chiua virens]|nr:hypothetical protein JVU11DRAFT_7059 [Chiua virens]